MIPLIEAEVVDSHHWLTHQEFVDATALGQITPGPVLISATAPPEEVAAIQQVVGRERAGALVEACALIAEADDKDTARAEVTEVLTRLLDGLRPRA